MSATEETLLYGPNGHQLHFEAKSQSERSEAFEFIERMNRAAFKSAESNRLNFNWNTSLEDINVILVRELRKLRARSRWLAANNPYGSSAVNTLVNFCVGTGFDLHMEARRFERQADGTTVAKPRDEFNDFVEDLFREWSEQVTLTSSDGSPDEFWEMQPLMFRRWVEDGEVFIVHQVSRAVDVVPFAMQVVDADFVDYNRTEYNGNPVIMGIELNATTWKPVAYWMHTTDVLDPRRPSRVESRRIPAENVIHLFKKRFPFQVRGIPFVTPVADKLYQVEQYNDAQLIRNKIAAFFSVMLEGMGDEAGDGFDGGAADTPTTAEGFPTDANGNRITNLATGAILKVPDGFKAHVIEKTTPESAYKMFLGSNLQAIGSGYEGGMSYIGLTRDTSDTTFAGGRQQENHDFQGYRPLMKHFAKKSLSAIFRNWFDAGVMSGAITVNVVDYEVNPRRWRRHTWMPAGWDRGINPLQQVNASEKSMQSGITTLDDEASALGYDAKMQISKRARIEKMKQDAGLPNELDGTAEALAKLGESDDDPAVEAEMQPATSTQGDDT
jgi:lambda family phage portal protein